jgi:hypothetical protein
MVKSGNDGMDRKTPSLAGHYLGSIGYPLFFHSSQPPLSAYTLGYPLAIKLSARLALEPSFFQAQ